MKTLTRRDEEEVLKAVRKEALLKCDDLVKAYTECCAGRWVSVAWKCRTQLRAMNECLHPHTSEAVMDAKRQEILARKTATSASEPQSSQQ
ncbi:hypothetical protein AMAG_16469 [Allomyces macrogynus ATCC 38327]|uniref:COX assembly mitochondrial protein n=1 Tax=Allomyces macrogynus (strain ATCC 38327) TaxID=578462 RepID=A0A0L0TCD9_ALLM3|nr:hypothetical protein AMAG_16469 [Allomyces macrogynus ATCC 38327]|eukprot:KNE72417.1 hypothetical protein AMAG_16469 [Allomyces macrogynus ATCC 38327]